MTDVELAPCPFCRQEFAAPGREGAGHFILCAGCGARRPRKVSDGEAAEAWNWSSVTTGGKAEPPPTYEPG